MKNKLIEKNITSTNLNVSLATAKISSLISVPLLNNQIEKIKSSTVNSLVEYNLLQKETEKDTKKGYKHRSQISINQNNKIINYLQENTLSDSHLSDKLQKILAIKNNSESFISYNDNKNINSSTYYLEDILNLIILHVKDNNKKRIAINLLKKLNFLNKNRKNRNKTPILSLYLKKIMPLFINNIEINKNDLNITKHEEQTDKTLFNKNLIEYNFKVKYVNPIEDYKNRNSLMYKSLPIEDKKLINTLLFIESLVTASATTASENKTQNKDSNTNNILLMTKQNLIRTITPFNSNELYSKNIMYNFNKRNSYNIFKNESNIFSILEAAFLSMDSLISKAIFSVKPNNILINLFFFWKPFSTNNLSSSSTLAQYSNYFSKFAIIYEKNLKNLSVILSKLLKKPVNFQFTRLYYPYNDSNIFACFIGYMSFFIKFTAMSKYFLNKMNFFITKRKFYRLKYRYIPSVVTGINIKLAGRILTVRTKRKVQSKKVQWGSLARTNNTLTSYSRFTNKNRTGAFSITVKNNTVIFK